MYFYNKSQFMVHKRFFLALFKLSLSAILFGQPELPYNDTTYFIPFDNNFNLINSASKGHQNNVHNLLKRGADINAVTIDNISALMYACENGNFSMVRLLLDKGADPNIRPYNGITALINAARMNYMEIAEILINYGADINAVDEEGVTSLHYAAAYNYPDLVKLLFYYNADPEKPDKKGNIPIVTAAWNNSLEALFILIENGVSINSQDKLGFTPLMAAIQQNNTKIVERLLQEGADVNLVNQGGMSALAFAVSNSDYDLTDQLIKRGANVNHNISNSYNILELAKDKGDEDIVDLLLASKARSSIIPHYEKLSLGTGLNFNSDDLATILNFSVIETKYQTDLTGSFSFRPTATRVLTRIENDTLFQFWERRYFISAGILKRISLIHTKNGLQSGPYASMNGLVTFGGYRGSTSHPHTALKFSPQTGWYLTNGRFSVYTGYQYLNIDTSSISPHRINISFAYNINLVRKKMMKKNIEWLVYE